jgi:hypothetical protein
MEQQTPALSSTYTANFIRPLICRSRPVPPSQAPLPLAIRTGPLGAQKADFPFPSAKPNLPNLSHGNLAVLTCRTTRHVLLTLPKVVSGTGMCCRYEMHARDVGRCASGSDR